MKIQLVKSLVFLECWDNKVQEYTAAMMLFPLQVVNIFLCDLKGFRIFPVSILKRFSTLYFYKEWAP